MGITAGLIISIGLMLVSRLLYKPPKSAKPKADDQVTTLTSRGEYVPLILGTRRVGYLFAWAGDRTSRQESVGGGGGKGMSGGSSKETIWYESGWHVLGVGPAGGLRSIYSNNKLIWAGNISSSTTPSGTLLSALDGEGAFYIYWGEYDQPINKFLGSATRVGVSSRWPHLCYIVWFNKKLGGSPTWPQIEYIVTMGCAKNFIDESWYLIEATDDELSSGINPAHILYQLLSAPFPHGVGIPVTEIDNDTLEAMGLLCEDGHLPANMLIDGGPEAARPIQGILQDIGITMPVIDGRLAFIINRASDDAVPLLDDDTLVPGREERTINHGEGSINRAVFSFKNEDQEYRDHDIKIDDDADIDESGRVSSQNSTIETATHIDVASRIARRRSQETDVTDTIKVGVLRGFRQLVAGQAVEHPDFGVMRILSKKMSSTSPVVELELAMDAYGVPDVDDAQTATSGGTSGTSEAEADIAFTWFELPPDLSTTISLVVLRVRAHDQIAGAAVYLSADAASYTRVVNQDGIAAGGLLEEAISATTDDIIAVGPLFEADNDDIANVLDLSSDTPSWQGGRQIAVINSEVFFVESITMQVEADWVLSTAYVLDDFVVPDASPTGLRYKCTTAGTSGATEPSWPTVVGETVTDGTAVWTAHRPAYTLDNMIRARYTSVAAAHLVGDRVFIADSDILIPIEDPLLSPGNDICIKTQPFTSTESLDISTVTPVCGTIAGTVLAGDLRVTQDDDVRRTKTGDIRAFIED